MRPEILFPLFTPLTSLKGVGPRVAPLLERLAGPLVRDVLWLQPHSLIRRTPGVISAALDGEVMTFEVTVESLQMSRSAARPTRMRVFDQTGFMTLVFFGTYGAQLEQRHPVDARRIISGKVDLSDYGLQMVHPDYMVAPDKAGDIPEVEPIYPATEGLPPRRVRGFVVEALARAPVLPEWQDPAWLAREQFPTWREALERWHAPQNEADLSPVGHGPTQGGASTRAGGKDRTRTPRGPHTQRPALSLHQGAGSRAGRDPGRPDSR